MPLPFARSASQTRPTFSRDFAGLKTLDHGVGPAITFTRASSATFFNASGVLQTASNDQPRFDHDPATGASRGLLIEESRTNHCTNSEASGAIGTNGPTGWFVDSNSSLGLTRTITTGVVNGMAYMDVRFNGTTTSGGSMRFDPRPSAGASASSGQAWTSSAYIALQAGNFPAGSTFRIYARGRDSSDIATDSAIGLTVSPTSSIARYSVAGTLAGATTARVTHDIRLESVPTATAVDFTLRIAAPQLEQGAFPTSYIPTTTAAATRSADSAVVTPISSFYNQADGTLFAEASTTSWTANSLMTVVAFDQSTNASDNVFRIIRNGPFGASPNNKLISVYRSGAGPDAAALASADGTWAFNVVARVASAYKVNDFAASLNGGAVLTDTSGALTTMNRMWLGNWAMNEISNGHIRRIAYYPRRLSNALLQQLTT